MTGRSGSLGEWQGMAYSLPQSGPSLVEMVFPQPGQLAMVNQ